MFENKPYRSPKANNSKISTGERKEHTPMSKRYRGNKTRTNARYLTRIQDQLQERFQQPRGIHIRSLTDSLRQVSQDDEGSRSLS